MDIQRRAKNLVRKYGTNCPFTIAKHLNINVQFVDLTDEVRGVYCRTLRRKFIGINSNLPYEWQRFVCAHELGHDLLHRGLGYYFIEQHTLFNPGRFERQANLFAVELLLSFDRPEDSETIEHFFLRNQVPKELSVYYIF